MGAAKHRREVLRSRASSSTPAQTVVTLLVIASRAVLGGARGRLACETRSEEEWARERATVIDEKPVADSSVLAAVGQSHLSD